MAIIDEAFDDLPVLTTLPAETECDLVINWAGVTPSKSHEGRENLALTFSVVGDPNVQDIRAWLPLPSKEERTMDPKAYVRKARRLRDFVASFNLEMPLDTDAIAGSVGRAILGEDVDLEGNPINTVRRFISK